MVAARAQRRRVLEPTPTLRQIITRQPFPPPADRANPDWRPVWDLFVRTYEPAMVRYVDSCLRGIRGRPPATDEATDVVRDFLARAMGDGRLSAAGPGLRTFRAWISTLLRRHVLDHLDVEGAAKRGGGARHVGVESLDGEPSGSGDPADDSLHAEIVRVAVARALARLHPQDETSAEIVEDLLRTEGEGSPDLAERLGIASDRLAARRHKARRAFGTLLIEELRGLSLDDDDFDDLCDRVEPYLP